MGLIFKKASVEDAKWAYQAVQYLLDRKIFEEDMFVNYWIELLSGKYGKCEVWIALMDGIRVSYIIANFNALPRYIGYSVELEEIVTLPEYQRKGIGGRFIDYLILNYKKDPSCRKIIVKTNDFSGAGKLYGKYFTLTNVYFYQRFLNKI